jgi:hypothetical protein
MIQINEKSPATNRSLNLPNKSNFNKLTVKSVNQENPSYLTTNTHQSTTKQPTIAEHKIINVDTEIKEILASIKPVLSYPEFIKLCNLDNQQLAADYLNNILQKLSTTDKRELILSKTHTPNQINLWSVKNNDHYPFLTKAIFSNNKPICKVLLDHLESNFYVDKLLHQEIDSILYLASREDLCCQTLENFFLNKCVSSLKEKKPADINDYTAALYLYQRILPAIKHYHNIGTYYLLLCNLLSCSTHIDIFNLIYQDIISLDENLVCESLAKPRNIAYYGNRLRHKDELFVKDLARFYLSQALKQALAFFVSSGNEKEISYISDILNTTKSNKKNVMINIHTLNVKGKTLSK